MNLGDIMPVDEKNLTIRLAHHEHTGHFFVDFVDKDKDGKDMVLISLKISQGEAEGISRHTGIRIFQ